VILFDPMMFFQWLLRTAPTPNLKRVAKTLENLSVLSETKVYLFWSRDWLREGKP